MPTQGALYVAYGRNYIAHAATSARSLRRHNDWLSVVLFADDVAHAREAFADAFDDVVPLCESPDQSDYLEFLKATKRLSSLKVLACDRSPFDRTLSIDSDTIVLGDLHEAFDRLDAVDLLLCEECWNTNAVVDGNWGATGLVDTRRRDLFNAGVLFLNTSRSAVRQFLTDWRDRLRAGDLNLRPEAIDQEVLNHMLWYPELFLRDVTYSGMLLKPEIYNCYCRMWMEVWESGFWPEVKIAHSWLASYLAASMAAGTPWEVFFSPENPYFEYISRFSIGGGGIPAGLKARLYALDPRRVTTLRSQLILAGHRQLSDAPLSRFDSLSVKYQLGYSACERPGGYGQLFEALLEGRHRRITTVIKLGVENTFASNPVRNLSPGFRTGYDLEFLAELFPAATVIGLTDNRFVYFVGERIETRFFATDDADALGRVVADLHADLLIDDDRGAAPERRAANFVLLCERLGPSGLAVMLSAEGAAGDRLTGDIAAALGRHAQRRYAISGWRNETCGAIVVKRVGAAGPCLAAAAPPDAAIAAGREPPGSAPLVQAIAGNWGDRFHGQGEIRFYGEGKGRFGDMLERFCAYRRDFPGERTPLCELMHAAGSDKSTKHNYTQLYDFLLRERREAVSAVFEVGLGTNFIDVPSNMGSGGVPGASLRAWRAYFPAARIYGADVDRRILFAEERISTFFIDQLDAAAIGALWQRLAEVQFDLLIDDGLHTFSANATLLTHSCHKLAASGFYVIEDISLAANEDYDRLFRDFGLHGFLLHSPNSSYPDDNGIAFLQRG